MLALTTLAPASSLQAYPLWAITPTNRRCTWRMRLSLNMLHGFAQCVGLDSWCVLLEEPCGMGGPANLMPPDRIEGSRLLCLAAQGRYALWSPHDEAEGYDRVSLRLPGMQEGLLKHLARLTDTPLVRA